MTSLLARRHTPSGLGDLYPLIDPWVEAALWHRAVDQAPPLQPLTAAAVDLIIEQKLAPLAVDLIRRSRITVAPELSTRLTENAFTWSDITLGVVTNGRAAVQELVEAGIGVAISKGPGIAACYPFVAARPFSDIDIVVDRARFPAARALLHTRGWSERADSVQPWGFFDPYCREAVNLRRASGESVDLHHRIPPWLWSQGLHPGGLIARSAPTTVLGRFEFPCLSPADNLLVAALHIVSDKNLPGKSLLVWRDLVQLSRAADPDDVVAAARAARLAGWLKQLLGALPAAVRPTELIAALPDQPIPHAARLRLLLRGDQQAAPTGVMRSQLLRLPPANGAIFAAGMAVPSPAFLAGKYGARFAYRRWWFGSR